MTNKQREFIEALAKVCELHGGQIESQDGRFEFWVPSGGSVFSEGSMFSDRTLGEFGLARF